MAERLGLPARLLPLLAERECSVQMLRDRLRALRTPVRGEQISVALQSLKRRRLVLGDGLYWRLR